MCVRHEALSVSPSHNTSGLKRSLTDQGEGEGAQEQEKAEQQKKNERRKTNQVGKWQGLYHTAGMFFICDTAAMSGTKKDKDVQIQSHKEESRGSSWEGSWSETRRLSSTLLQAAGTENHCHISSMAINVKWAVGTKLPDKVCAWLNATSELALISATSAKNDQMAVAPGLSLPCHRGVHEAQGRVTAGMIWGISATTQMFSCIGRYLQS